MREAERIADQLKRSFYGEAWSGPSVKEAVEGVTASMAVEHPLQDIHSIWELVHHVTAWVDIVRRRVEREVFAVSPEMNFPPVADDSEAAWQESLRRMEQAESELRTMI